MSQPVFHENIPEYSVLIERDNLRYALKRVASTRCWANYRCARTANICNGHRAPRNVGTEFAVEVLEVPKVIPRRLGCEGGRNVSLHVAYQRPSCPIKWAPPDVWT